MKIKLLLLFLLGNCLFYTNANAQYCSGTTYLTSVSGSFSDGSGANSYLGNSNCSWLIQPSTGGTITLNFSSFFTEVNFDYVKVYNGSTPSGSTLLGSFSGSTIPPSLSSNTGTMLVVFNSDASTNYSGWDANYTSTYVQYCSGTMALTNPSGTFSDGSGPNNYNNNSNCQWLIQPSGGGNITLSFTSFNTESFYDYVTVYDGSTTSGTYLGQFSGSSLPPSVTSTSSSMLVVFTSNSSTNYSGWDASYVTCSVSVPVITYSGTLNNCNGPVNKTLTTPLVSGYTYVWFKNSSIIPNAISNSYTATDIGTYTVLVKNSSGCSKQSAPVTISNAQPSITISSSSTSVCTGGKTQLNAYVANGLNTEDFTNFNAANWVVTGGVVSPQPCSFTSSAMFFDGNSERSIKTNPMDLTNAGNISFKILVSNGITSTCEQVDSGEEVVLQYSTNGGSTWNLIQTFYPLNTIQVADIPVPAAAKTSNSIIRLYQLSSSGSSFDNWVVDDLGISTPSTTNNFTYSWSPTTNLNNASVANPLATVNGSVTYTVTGTEVGTGCVGTKQITLSVSNNSIPVTINSTQKSICAGGSAQFAAIASGSGSGSTLSDDFETTNNTLWPVITGGTYSSTCGSYSGLAIIFYSSDYSRLIQSKAFNTTSGGTIDFYLKMPNSSSSIYCENPDSGEEVVLEYSTDNVYWYLINTYYNSYYPEFTKVSETVPAGAKGANVYFRWRQLSNSGSDFDYWGLDHVTFNLGSSAGSSNYTYSWSPSNTLSNPTQGVTTASPSATTTYTVIVVDALSNCNGAAATVLNVGGGTAPAAPVITKNNNTFYSSYSTGNQWYFNASPIVGATGSTYSSTTPGSYSVEYTSTNGCSSISSPSNIIVSGLVNFDNAESNTLYIYPNPIEDNSFTVTLNSNLNFATEVKVTDINGQVVTSQSFASGKEFVITTPDLSKGVYFVKVTSGESSYVKKIVKR